MKHPHGDGGKQDGNRSDSKKYRDNFDKIKFGTRKKKKSVDNKRSKGE